jgi:hypothetical protein
MRQRFDIFETQLSNHPLIDLSTQTESAINRSEQKWDTVGSTKAVALPSSRASLSMYDALLDGSATASHVQKLTRLM